MTDAQRDAMVADQTSFDTKFNSFKCLLTAEQIRKLSKLSPEDIGLLDLALTFGQQNSNEIPGTIDVPELGKDVALAKQLAIVYAKVAQEAEMVRCSLIAVMSDGFKASRDIYRVAQAQGRTPQNSTFLDRFGARFARGPQPAKQSASGS